MENNGNQATGAIQDSEGSLAVSPLLHVGSFLGECLRVLGSEELMLPKRTEQSSEDMAQRLGTSAAIVDELEKVCGPATLQCPAEEEYPIDEKSLGTDQGIPLGAEHLKTLQVRHAKYSKSDKRYRRSEVHLDCHATYVDDEEENCVEKPSALLEVTIFRSSMAIDPRNVYRPNFIDRELLVPTDQKLTSLRDKIICTADMCVASGEYSLCPDAPQDTTLQDLYKSSYFLIEDCFYNDFRDPLSRDLSKVVIDWMKHKKKMTSRSMDDITFDDLHLKLGYPYVYCHLGHCQHIIVFTDLRLLTNTDCQDLSRYPLLINKPYWKRVICICCRIFTAKWKTTDDSLSIEDPSFFCEKCFRMLHYDKEENKLGSFKAYPYADPGIFS